MQNPAPGDPASIFRGAALFTANCAACHGQSGLGDGPRAASLSPRPTALTVHVPLHGDGEIYGFISDGLVGTAMPAWSATLAEQQRWDLVNYLRATFERKTQ